MIGIQFKRKSNLYKEKITTNINIHHSDLRRLLEACFYALSPRYLLWDMPGFIFTDSWRLL